MDVSSLMLHYIIMITDSLETQGILAGDLFIFVCARLIKSPLGYYSRVIHVSTISNIRDCRNKCEICSSILCDIQRNVFVHFCINTCMRHHGDVVIFHVIPCYTFCMYVFEPLRDQMKYQP